MNLKLLDTDAASYIERVRLINKGRSHSAYVFTFGCQQNEADSEKIKGLLFDMGYSISDKPEGCDVIILNTCAIREHAEMKALSMLGRFKAIKRENPELVVGLMGCMAAEAHNVELLKRDFHYVSFTLEPHMLYMLPKMLFTVLEEKRRILSLTPDETNIVEGVPLMRKSRHSAWVSVMYGCNNFCSYCIVPYVRGRERSRDSSAIINECKELIADGCREITLLGQNVNSYKSDIDFAELIKRIALLDGDFIIRFMTSHPKDVSDRLIDVMAEYRGKIAPYFHLPLQSGSDRILKAMNRTYTSERFLSVVEKLRYRIPGIAISSDIIVGFPTESEEDFLKTVRLAEAVRFDMVYAFKYSPRTGTPAAKMKEQVPDEVKEDRIARLLSVLERISFEKNQPYTGTYQRVLADSEKESSGKLIMTGRTDTGKLVHFQKNKASVGEFTQVKILEARGFDLIAEEI